MANQMVDFVLVPFWVEQSLSKAKIPLQTILDYNKLRDIISLQDVVSLYNFQDLQLKVTERLNLGSLFSSWSSTAQGAYKQELDSVLVPLSSNKEQYIDGFIQRLTPETDQETVEDSPYKIVNLGNSHIGIIIYPRFIEYSLSPDNANDVMRELIRQLYVYNAHTEVSSTGLFEAWVKNLKAVK